MERIKEKNNKWFGLVLVLIGTAFFLDNLDLIPRFIPYWVFTWKMLLIVIGAAMLISHHKGGIVFLIIGTFFLIPEILHYPRFYFRDWWPLLLVILGLSMILRNSRGHGYPGHHTSEVGDDYLDDTSILGGGTRIITSKRFRGGKISAVFGGSEIHLLNAELADGQAVIDLFVMFGGTSLIVPADWTVKSEVTSILGGFADKRRLLNQGAESGKKELVIKGFVMFGGGEIKSA